MAVKDHSLDNKIVKAAKEEFLKHGFQKASLHKIAENANITTGALYTRYKNKDALFCSLVENSLKEIGSNFEPMKELYLEAQKEKSVDKLLEAIKEEERIYLELMFTNYDECVLFFCKSDGSSIGSMMDKMMEEKAKETVEFLKGISKVDINLSGIELIMYEQFHYYRQILLKGYSREDAVECMKTVELFLEAGWRALFEKII